MSRDLSAEVAELFAEADGLDEYESRLRAVLKTRAMYSQRRAVARRRERDRWIRAQNRRFFPKAPPCDPFLRKLVMFGPVYVAPVELGYDQRGMPVWPE